MNSPSCGMREERETRMENSILRLQNDDPSHMQPGCGLTPCPKSADGVVGEEGRSPQMALMENYESPC